MELKKFIEILKYRDKFFVKNNKGAKSILPLFEKMFVAELDKNRKQTLDDIEKIAKFINKS